MPIQESIRTYIAKEPNQRKVNSIYCFLFFLIISFNLLYAAYYLLIENPLFFFTCDNFEVFLTGTLAYLFYYKLLPLDSLKYKVFGIVFAFLLLLGLTYLKVYRRNMFYPNELFETFTSYIGLVFLFTSLFYIFNNLNLLFNNSYVKTKKALGEAQQLLLRQQFNPHFLYNAFNSLYSMSIGNHTKTSDSILKLSGMMRYLTDEAPVSGVLLKHEFKFIQDYLEIEKIRFGEKANISMEINGLIKGQLIEPLLLVNLVENAFKHGFYTNNDLAYVNITVDIKENDLSFVVKNSIFEKQHFQDSKRVGKGLENLKKRLSFSYLENASLHLSKTDKEFIATLNIKLKQ